MNNHDKVALTALYTSVDAILFSLFLTSFREKFNDVDVDKNQDKCLFRGSLALSFDVT